MSDLRILRHDIGSDGPTLDELTGFEDDFLLGEGEPVAHLYPTKKRPVYTVDKSSVTKPGPEKPGRAGKTKASTKLTDSLHNIHDMWVVSERVKAIVEKAEKKIEFLPVTIQGYEEPYFIANLLDHVACLDLVKSKAKKHAHNGKVANIQKLVIREEDVPEGRALFRVKEYPDIMLVRTKLATALEEAGLTGVEIMALEDYRGD